MKKPPGTIRWLAYTLLAVGAVVFTLPLIWMAGTSVKVGRELYVTDRGGVDLLPDWPQPRQKSPYVDERYYENLIGPYQQEMLAKLEALIDASNFDIPEGLVASTARQQLARGLYRHLHNTLPPQLWEGDSWGTIEPKITLAIKRKVTRLMMDEVMSNIHRQFRIGAVRAHSRDFEVARLDRGKPISQRVTNLNGEVAELRDWQRAGSLPEAVVHYDFSKGDRILLQRTFEVPFPVDRLKRIELDIQPDDTWHTLSCTIETATQRYLSQRPTPLANSLPTTLSWQRHGEDDRSTKIKTWVSLKDEPMAGDATLVGNQIRVTFTVEPASQYDAIISKLRFNYDKVADHIPFGRYLRVSLFLVAANIFLTLLSSSLVAYAFARLNWPGRDFCFVLMLATMMIPPQVTMIPGFLIWKNLGFYNTLTPLWAGAAFGGAFFVFLLRQFMKSIPRDLEDAARIDGCGFLGIYWNVVLPLVKPSLAAIAVFTFMGSWNDFLGPLIYIADQRLYSLAFGLYAFSVQVSNNPGMTMAAALLMTLPVIAIFFFAQRYFIQGVTLTGLKG